MKAKLIAALLVLPAAGLLPAPAPAQTTYTENFTGTTTTNSWTFLNGACLTAGTSATSTVANPACVALSYAPYSESGAPNPQFGGDTGTLPDTTANGGGALRFTDWYTQSGAILSNFSFPLTGAGATGLQISFTTVTYEGDSGGTGGDGADGMSFFLQDASQPANIGAFGGSLAYTCTNETGNYSGTLGPYGLPRGYDGLQGGFIGLGIDEYGNFLNNGDNTATGDPATLSDGSGDYQPGRIGLRGPGSTTWNWLNATYPQYYPSSLTTLYNGDTQNGFSVPVSAQAVQKSCSTGYVWNYSNPNSPVETAIALTDYAAVPKAYSVLPTTKPIANESATKRSQAIPIVYNLSIIPQVLNGANVALLSLSYSYNGGALQNVITSQDITAGGTVPVPANVRFGFAGSTGGSRNIHEIMCFQATPANTSQSSAGLNQKQTAKVQTGTQVYFAFYNPATLAGSLTSQYLVGDKTNPNDLFIDSTINWDGSCVLTGVASGSQCDYPNGPAGPITAQGSTSRAIFTWNGTTGVPFEYSSLSTSWPSNASGGYEQALIDAGDGTAWTAPPTTSSRVNYLRGNRGDELTPEAGSSTTYQGVFRDRTSVLGDIIDSSPTWVGPPNSPYPNAWVDKYTPAASGDVMSENTGETYGSFSSITGMYTRTNVVYAGANDGMLHGFRSGYFSGPTTYQEANNDGEEMMAYVPGYIVNTIQNATTASSNYSDPQYGHHFDVDAPPGTGDLYYQGTWHTWLVGGLGPGGNAIYALDVTNPGLAGANNFSETGAGSATAVPATTVIGEWSTTGTTTSTTTTSKGKTTTTTTTTPSLVCVNNSSCASDLGQTYGVPQIRRFHNGSWGAVFGNGYKSSTGDAGIYVMLVNPTNGPFGGGVTFYYLSTQTPSTTNPNGIYYTTPADLDGDHITDYVYAGDLLGHIWRFDLTSSNPANWGVVGSSGTSIVTAGGSPVPLYTTPTEPMTSSTGAVVQEPQPITTKLVVASVAGTSNPHVLVEFGTGQQTPMKNLSPATYLTYQQSLYGIWDWNLATWNANSTATYASLPSGGIAKPSTALSGITDLQQQTITGTYSATVSGTGTDYRTVSSNAVCYADSSGCTQYGWYLNLVSGVANKADPAVPQASSSSNAGVPTVWEQITFNPSLEDGAFVVNTTIPPATAATMCFSAGASGWTMALNPATGGAFTNSFFGTPSHTYLNVTTETGTGSTSSTTTTAVSGLALGGTGSTSVVIQGTQSYVATQTVNGVGALISVNPPGGLTGSRLTWIERR